VLRVVNGSLYHNRTLRVYPCSNSCTIQVKKPHHNATEQSASESESMEAAAVATKKPRHEKNASDTKTITLSMGKERLQSAAATHHNSIAEGALKQPLGQGTQKQDAVAQQQKKRRARSNMPLQKKAKTATSAPKRRKKPDPQLQKKLQSAVHAMKCTSSKGGRSSLFSSSSRK